MDVILKSLLIALQLVAACGILPETPSGDAPGDVADPNHEQPAAPSRAVTMTTLGYAINQALNTLYNQNLVGAPAGGIVKQADCPLGGKADIRGSLAISTVPGGQSTAPNIYLFMNACGFSTDYGSVIFTTPLAEQTSTVFMPPEAELEQAVHMQGAWVNDGVGAQLSSSSTQSGTAALGGQLTVEGQSYAIAETECEFSLTYNVNASNESFTGIVCGETLLQK